MRRASRVGSVVGTMSRAGIDARRSDERAEGKMANRVFACAAGAITGAVAMFLWDPRSGKRRRAMWRQRAASKYRGASQTVAAHSRDLGGRARGAMQDMKASTEPAAPPSDDILKERVRARLGHVVSHAHSLEVQAEDGMVTISGPVAQGVEQALIDEISRVPGVRDVETELTVQPVSESTPELRPHRPRAWFRMRTRGLEEPVSRSGDSNSAR